jgi:hypothetical protein
MNFRFLGVSFLQIQPTMKLTSPLPLLCSGGIGKLLGIFFLLVTTWATGSAQNFRLGVQGGIDLTQLRYVDLIAEPNTRGSWGPVVSGNANLYLGFRFTEKLGLALEPGFIQKSANFRSFPVGQAQFLFAYLPILAQWKLTDQFSLVWGPELSTPLRSRGKRADIQSNLAEHPAWQIAWLEVSGTIGVEYALLRQLDLGIRYNHAFTSAMRFQLPQLNQFGETVSIIADLKTYTQYGQLFLRWKW